jgi:phosphate-selective porin OprO/OprP
VNNELFNEEEQQFVRVAATGFQVTLASFLTGERVRGREAVDPLRPFDPRTGLTGPNAWEPFVRFSYLRIGDELFAEQLANAEEWTDEVAMTDVGINWYMNRFAKFYLDWQHCDFASPVLVNANENRFSDSNDLFWLRCQLYF